MPFAEEWHDVYELGIKPACEAAGMECARVDEQIFLEHILKRMYSQIDRATLVVAEMTGRNPNVFYEAGYAHGIGKPVIFLTKSGEDIPFDLKQYPHVVYEGRIAKLKEELNKRIRWCLAHPELCVGIRDGSELPPELETMATQIENLLRANNWERVSFERIARLHPSFTREAAERLITLAPKRFRAALIKREGKRDEGLATLLPSVCSRIGS